MSSFKSPMDGEPDGMARAEAEARHMAHFGRLMELSHMQAKATRVTEWLEELRDEARHLGIEEAADWFHSASCATQGGAKELAKTDV